MFDSPTRLVRAALCALSLFATAPVWALAPYAAEDAAPRQARDPVEARLHASLLRAVEAGMAGHPQPARIAGLPPHLVADDRVLVEIRHEVRGRDADALPGLLALGADIRHPGHRGLTEAWVPLSRLRTLAALPGVHRVGLARPVRTLAGSVISEGLAAGAVAPWHAAGLDGSGVTIAVIDRFDDTGGQIGALQASGDWPPEERLLRLRPGGGSFGADGEPHGNALLEVVYDLAPGADFLAFDVLTPGDWREAIDQALQAGADVIVSALAAPLDGIGDGSALPGSVAEMVAVAASQGVLYLNAAGNARMRHWGGSYAPSTNPAIHSWSGANDRYNAIADANGDPVCIEDGTLVSGELFWDDWSAVDHDYDLELREYVDDGENEIWVVVATSQDSQDGGAGQRPQERIEVVVNSVDSVICGVGAGRYGWRVNRVSAASPRNLQFFSSHRLQYRVEARSLVFPADSPAAIAVAAIDVATSAALPDSSQGPILAPGGGLPAGDEFPKPDLASFAGVATVSLGAAGFGGTSAAAAHAAGMAALLRQRHPDFSRDQLADRLRAIAATGSNDLGPAGHDFRFGAGRLRFQQEAGLVVTGSPATAVVGEILAPVAVALLDDEGQLVLSGPATSVAVALGQDPSAGAATLSGTLAQPLDAGEASFGDLGIDQPGAGYTLAFSVDSAAQGAESAPFNVVQGGPGVPSQLIFVVQPASGVAGEALTPVVTVEVQDSEGAVVVGDNATVVGLELVDDPGDSGLSGAGPLAVTNGVAQFPLLAIERAGTGYRLRATTPDSGIVEGESQPFDILPGPPARITIIDGPQNVGIAEPLPPVTVAITDLLGNPQSADDETEISVLLHVNPGGASLTGTLTRTVSAGVAIFDDLDLDAAGAGYRLLFRAAAGALEEALEIEGFSLAANQSASRVVAAGLENRALVRGLRFTGTVTGIGNSSTYASDLRMDVVGPSGSTFAVGGFNDAAPVPWDFQGSGSTADGTYTSSHELIFDSLLGEYTADAGDWSFSFRHDWAGSSSVMSWSQVSVDLLKGDLYAISEPFSVGTAQADVALSGLAQTYDGSPRIVTATTNPPGLAVEVTYDGSTSPPVAAGSYAVLATVIEESWTGSASGELVVAQAPTSTLLQSAADPSPIGEPLLLTATVSGVDPEGTVAFRDGGEAIAGCDAVALVGSGAVRTAECSVASLPGGERALSAAYGGDANHLPSGSGTLAQTISPYATALTLDQLDSSSDRGEPATFSATLTVPPDAIFAPAGTLTISASQGMSALDCQTAVAAAGSHGCSIGFPAPAAGEFVISAAFTPADGNFAASSTAATGAHAVFRVADLELAKVADPAYAEPAEEIDFILTLTNLGPHEAVAVELVDALPEGFVDALWVCEGAGGASCPEAQGAGDIAQILDLPAGASLVYTVNGVIAPDAELPLVNVAVVATTAAGFTRDPEPGNNTASATVLVESVFADGFEAPPEP
jgi:uncharacterized repeat protein (TIGR01451 family)